MLKDLFSTTSQTDALRAKTKNNRFTTDFAISFAKNKQQKIKGSNGVALNYLSNSDALINYLIESNVSIYCPHPINEYKEDNRRPAISFHPIDNDSINVGYVVQENGGIAKVIVSQSYNDNHPVLILMPYEEEVVVEKNNAKQLKQNNGNEVSVVSIICKQYYGGIFDGDLDLHIIRINPGSVTYSPATNTYSGGILTDLSFRLPRSYVTNAKKNWLRGWFNLDLVWDTDWDESKKSSVILIYERDRKGTQKTSVPLNTYDADGKVIANLGTLETTTQSQDATIGLNEWSRYWFFDIINNGNPSWYWAHENGDKHYKLNGNNVIKISNDFYMTMKVRAY